MTETAGRAANPAWNPWANDRSTYELYRRRCRREAEEMTCAAQVAELIAPLALPGDTLLDAGCGGGYYYWSFADRKVPVEYHGIDYTPEMIELARSEMGSRAGLPTERFRLEDILHLDREYDHVVCFNVLTNNPHYAQPLERLLACARKTLVLRESLGDRLISRYTPDPYLDEGKRHIRVYHNMYPLEEVEAFIAQAGFSVRRERDRRSGDGEEMVVDIPHRWRILVAERKP